MTRPSLGVPLAIVFFAAACTGGRAGRELEVSASLARRGRELVRELGCTGCHASPDPELAPREAARLEAVGARLRPEHLRGLLADPLSAGMPDCLAGLARKERADAREALVHFLASLGGPLEVRAHDVDAHALEHGRQIYHRIGCVACHPPFEDAANLEQPLWAFEEVFTGSVPETTAEPDGRAADPLALPELRARTTLAALARTLADPLAVHPSGRMPTFDLLEEEAFDLAAYLFFEEAVEAGARLERASGLAFEYFEASFDGESADFDALEPVRRGVATSFFAPGPAQPVVQGAIDAQQASQAARKVQDLERLEPALESGALLQGREVEESELAPAEDDSAGGSAQEGIERREDDFGLRFHGFVEVPRDGTYTFSTTSDDGSTLSIDGKLVVDNQGQHAMEERSGEVRLAAGFHALEVTYFEHLGDDGLEVAWSGPELEEQDLALAPLSHGRVRLGEESLPFVPDPGLVASGRELYGELGCAACHPLEHAASSGARPAAPPFAELESTRGCLAKRVPETAPRYAFQAGEREALRAALVHPGAASPASAAELLEAELVRLNCVACHARGALGGPSDERRPYFRVKGGLDVGDEGRLPPRLDRTGAKLKASWLREVLLAGSLARPYMETRMPRFGERNVAHLPGLFEAADAPLCDLREPEFSLEAVEDGRKLAGTKALGCINCHGLAGHPSLGIPAVDLARVHERLHPGWFRELLMDPVAIGMNTRMPSFWSDGKSPVASVLDGDPARQVDALWSWLSLGSALPLPDGLVPSDRDYEVEVGDRPVCVGVFMDGVSPRTIAVGFPERVHVVFDVEHSRLALAWRGRFLNARGTWHGRAGRLEKPAGEDVLEFPTGPAFARLEKPDDPWPNGTDTEEQYRALGRTVWEGRPTFKYEYDGIEISETARPRIHPGGSAVVREWTLPQIEREAQLYLRIAVGDSIERVGEGVWVVTGKRRIRIYCASFQPYVAKAADGMELRWPITKDSVTSRSADTATYEVEYLW